MASDLRSTYQGASIDSDGDVRCKCGFDLRTSTVNSEKSPFCGKRYMTCKQRRRNEEGCRIYIWSDELPRIKRLLPRFSEPKTPKKTADIRRFGIVTPSSSRKTPRSEQGHDVSTQKKRSLFTSPGQDSKRAKILTTPPGSPCPPSNKFDGIASPRSGESSYQGKSCRWEEYQKDLLRTPSKVRPKKTVEEEDLLSDWEDAVLSEVIRIADGMN